ncbi:MAG TPA: sulfatase-like hydrolase/transferase [Candidatus Paceibacterota bacterium]|nr:sulfatase-like hydrolase/transferase [Candidatus Paceibacterota bacterium]
MKNDIPSPSSFVRATLLIVLGLIAPAVGPAAVPAADASPRPNVLFFFTDDQRPDTIQALGNPHIRTPNLDRLASQGVAFTHAYIMGGLQGAVCVPSRAMLMTSRGLFRVKDNLAGQTTWPEQFARAGYRTFMTGKWHNGAASAVRAFQEGRNAYFGGMSPAYNMPVQDFKAGQGPGPKHTSPLHHTELFANTAIEFLREQTNGQPFLCYVAFKSPHDPRTATPAWHDYYRAHSPPLPANLAPMHPFDNGEMTVRDEKLLPWPRTPEAVRHKLEDYYACISHVDEQIGRVLAALRERGLETNTLVAFAGDNGLAIGSHGLMGKQNVYEHSVRVPLLLAGPGIPKGRRTDAFCYLLDVFPTLAELVGVPMLPEMEGRSLAPLFAERPAPVRDSVFTAYRSFQRAVRDRQWKLIRYPQINKTQLFNLDKDPDELRDLSALPEFADNLARLRRLLEEQQRAFGDTLPLEVVNPKPAAWSPPAPDAKPSGKP